jgi:predicted transcriptional regulator
MALNEKQIKILKVIDDGTISGERIADALGSSMQMLRYYLDTMAEDGYLKAAKVYDNNTKEFQIVRAYLTDKGKAILEQLNDAKQVVNEALTKPVSVEQSTESSNTEQNTKSSGTWLSERSASQEKATPQQISLQDLEQIIHSLDALQKIVEDLADDRRDIISVYLSDLHDEIKIVYKRRPQRIKAYFLAVLATTLPIIKQTSSANDFVEHAQTLSEKLSVPVKLPSL